MKKFLAALLALTVISGAAAPAFAAAQSCPFVDQSMCPAVAQSLVSEESNA
ncbi:hypothetical protein [Devosia sp. RR2S18]|uniref:hypothetical protein n=1 Tax=Devosia rhizosphaerae TaxID=3049774 RepID=UPI002540877C|nr:hypothetical protein [Devosia sp. RR2S18]WIJ23730.1 hypothetical protein QOV41_11725 [Devosia sp. RR2S18]